MTHVMRFAISLIFFGACAATAVAQTPTPSQTPARPAAAQSAAAPTAGFRAEFLRELSAIEEHYVSLAQSIPAEKYTWRPGEGVRSISEVFLHVAAANFNLPRLVGTQPPTGFTARGFETSTTDKARVTDALRQSFAHLRQATLAVSDTDAERTFPWLNNTTNTYRGHFLFMTRHLSEHMGQMIAYARMNGVVPPWTEEQQRQRQQQQQRPQQQPQQPATPRPSQP